jgi:hypothetical protein
MTVRHQPARGGELRERDSAPILEVVLVPPDDAEAAWGRFIETADWVATLGALDS